MLRMRSLSLVCLLLAPGWMAPPSDAESVDTLQIEDFRAGAPDADLAVPLRAVLRSHALSDEPLAWRLDAEHTPPNATEPVRWTAANGTGLADPSGRTWAVNATASQGAGAYRFTLVAGSARLAEANASLEVNVSEPTADQAAVNFTFDVEDAPTLLRLANDTVNSDGKNKSPGSALITRLIVSDANGLRDVARVAFAYSRNDSGLLTLVETHTLQGFGNATDALLEDRFNTSPIKDGAYACTITAFGSGAPTVTRTFNILDAAADGLVALSATSVWPLQPSVVAGTIVVRDANFGTGPSDPGDIRALGTFRLQLYKGSAKVNDPGWSMAVPGLGDGLGTLPFDLRAEGTRTTRFAYSLADGKGQLSVPVEVHLPAAATAGTYRLSLIANSTNATLASASFDVRAVPRVTKLILTGAPKPGQAILASAEVSPPDGVVAVEARAPWGTLRRERAQLAEQNGTLRWDASLQVPRPWPAGPANVTFLVDFGRGEVVLDALGLPVNARSTAVTVANAPPTLLASVSLDGLSLGSEAWLHPRSGVALEVHAQAGDDNAVLPDLSDELRSVEIEARDWNKTLVNWTPTSPSPAGPAFEVPLNLSGAERGRYTLTVRARDRANAAAERVLVVHVGARFRLEVEAPAGGARFEVTQNGTREASLRVRNAGNAAAGTLAVLAEGLPPGVTDPLAMLVLPNGTEVRMPLEGGFARFNGLSVAPGESMTLFARVGVSAGVPSGSFAGRLIVAGEAA